MDIFRLHQDPNLHEITHSAHIDRHTSARFFFLQIRTVGHENVYISQEILDLHLHLCVSKFTQKCIKCSRAHCLTFHQILLKSAICV